MRRESRIGIAAACIFLVCAAIDRPAEAETVVSIEVIRADGERRRFALEREQRISTDAKSIAVVRYRNGSVVYVAPESSVRLGSIFVEIGEIFVKAKDFFRAETRFVVAGSEGTEYSVRVKGRDDAVVAVLTGKVRCISKKVSWPEFFLTGGEIAFFDAQNSPVADRAKDFEMAVLKRKFAELERIASPP